MTWKEEAREFGDAVQAVIVAGYHKEDTPLPGCPCGSCRRTSNRGTA